MVTTPLIPLLPLIGAALLFAFGRRFKNVSGFVATAFAGSSFTLALMALGDLLAKPEGERILTKMAYEWVAVGDLTIAVSFRVDPLSATMILVVTGIGSLIHIYSIGYMADDPRKGTFFAYLNLFLFSMLVLVLANNFLLLYVGWELVGACSYLLISFWREKPAAAAAGKKAFIVNRIGDLGLLIGILLLYRAFGTLDFDTILAAAPGVLTGALVTAVPLLLFLGACGKSAQLPLHVWLPDAMEGPTPVSALIHAATMVTAGVYLVARAHPLFEASTAAAYTVAIVGTATAVFAAVIAIGQDDIKRVLAYSTISQLGYMFLAVGLGAVTGSPLAYAAGIFHLVTHGFFKALLFLGAGSVMHATGGETDMKKMGGLLKVLPVTGGTFIIGWLAIAGIPPLAGFFSKDAILFEAWESGAILLWLLGLVTSGITAYYMSRQVILTFLGRSRLSELVVPHESPPIMTMPLRILALGALSAGGLGLSIEAGVLPRFLLPVFGESEHALHPPLVIPEGVLAAIAVLAGLAGIALALRLYLSKGSGELRAGIERRLGVVAPLVRNKFYVDELYGALIVWPAKAAARVLAFFVDSRLIDGAVNGVGAAVALTAVKVRRVQTGLVRRYALAIALGAAFLVAFLILRLT